MRYAIYLTWKEDGFEDGFNVDGAKERDTNIKQMVARNEFGEIRYCKIYKNGECGKRVKVL